VHFPDHPNDKGKPLKRYEMRFKGFDGPMRTADTAVNALAAFDEMIIDWVFSVESIIDHAAGETLTIQELEKRAAEEQSRS
jgi:hypothetical protein